jgi:hypothetical protein
MCIVYIWNEASARRRALACQGHLSTSTHALVQPRFIQSLISLHQHQIERAKSQSRRRSNITGTLSSVNERPEEVHRRLRSLSHIKIRIILQAADSLTVAMLGQFHCTLLAGCDVASIVNEHEVYR